MNAMTTSFLRVLKRVERIEKDRANDARRRAEERSRLATRYAAYKASQAEVVPWEEPS